MKTYLEQKAETEARTGKPLHMSREGNALMHSEEQRRIASYKSLPKKEKARRRAAARRAEIKSRKEMPTP